jgi:hypothetical protein
VTAAEGKRWILPVTCRLHGTAGFTNLHIKPVGPDTIEFDPHVTGQCVLSLGRQQVRELVTRLSAWL